MKNPPAMQETWVRSLAGKIPWRRERLPTLVFWLAEFHGLYSPWGGKESDTNEQLSLLLTGISSLIAQLVKYPPAMQETPVLLLGWEDLLMKGWVTHSGIHGLPLWLSWLRILLQCWRPGFDPWVGKISWRRERLPTPVFWPGEFQSMGPKESDTTEQL